MVLKSVYVEDVSYLDENLAKHFSDLVAYIPDFKFAFFDIPRFDKNSLQKIQNKVVLYFYVAMVKTLHSSKLKELLPDLVEGLCKTLNSRTVMDYISIFYRYILRTTDSVNREDMQHALNILPQGGEYIMNTLAEEWKQEGIVIGEQRGIIIGEQRGELKNARQVLLAIAQDRCNSTVRRSALNLYR